MKALRLHQEGGAISIDDVADPAPPTGDDVLVRMKFVSLNHIDLFGFRGMAFAKRSLPIIVGVEGVGVVESTGPEASRLKKGDAVVIYPGLFCGACKRCKQGRENLCENNRSIMGFHVDGIAAELVKAPMKRVVKVPAGAPLKSAACTTVTFATVQHMLFDNAKLESGETILVHAAGSGIGSTAIKMAKAVGCTVFTTVGSDDKIEKAKALGADHVINYTTERFEGRVRRLTDKRGVDVVFEHVGPTTWGGSLLSMAFGGRLVTCGSTTGITAETNLYQVFQMQLKIFGSFGSSIRNVRECLDKMAAGMAPAIDTEIALSEFPKALERLKSRQVFGKIIAAIP